MTESREIAFPAESEVTSYLVSDEDAVAEMASSLEEQIDEHPGVQARVPLSKCTTPEAYNSVLRAAKVGSRWGKDLEDVYRDAADSFLITIDGPSVAGRVREWYNKYNADAHKASLTEDALNIGIGVKDAIQETFDDWDKLVFSENDLTAAIEIAREDDNTEWECAGYVVLESREPPSRLRDNNSIGQLVQVVQRLRLLGLEVAIVSHKHRANEHDIVKDIFRPVGGFGVVDTTNNVINVTDDVKSFVDEWYDRLCYNVHSKNVSERTAQLASVTAHDLDDDEGAMHFIRAIRDGLQSKYSEKKFNYGPFKKLWEKRVIPHERYDPSRSKHADFPTVKVTRSDRVSRVFKLHHEGPRVRPHLNGVPVESDSPTTELIELIERFLDAETVDEDRWQELVETAQLKFGDTVSIPIETFVDNVLLRRTRKRAELIPLIGPPDRSSTDTEQKYDREWYSQHWSTILSGYRITTQVGTNAIKRKQQLMQSLDGKSVADSFLYHKLNRDVKNAWEKYIEDVESGVEQNLPSGFKFESDQKETSSGRELVTTIITPDGVRLSTTITVHLPYSEVYVEEEKVKNATATRTVATILDTFDDVLYQRTTDDAESELDFYELLYSIIEFYVDIMDCDSGDLVYFDDLISFCYNMPGLRNQLSRSSVSSEDSLRTAFSDERLIRRLRDDGVRFHRKGSDDHGSIETEQNRYVAFEVVDSLI